MGCDIIIMSKGHTRNFSQPRSSESFLTTMHNGFNYFHEIDLPRAPKTPQRNTRGFVARRKRRIKTAPSIE